MSLGTHAAIGAIIISKFPDHPVLGFCLAFGSHFILDAIPHWDYHLSSFQENKNDPMKNRMPITGKFLVDVFKMGFDFARYCRRSSARFFAIFIFPFSKRTLSYSSAVPYLDTHKKQNEKQLGLKCRIPSSFGSCCIFCGC